MNNITIIGLGNYGLDELPLGIYKYLKDANVVAGGVVIASDLGNFDGGIESKISSMLETLDLVI